MPSAKEKLGRQGEVEYELRRKLIGIRDVGEDGVEVDSKILQESETRVYNDEGEKVTLKGNVVIAAEGPSSTVKDLVCPEVQKTYAEYVAWRGPVLESEASNMLKRIFVDKFTFFHDFWRGIQFLA